MGKLAQEANMYFGTHLNHMLGRMMEESGPYGKRFVCKEKEGMDWKACIDNFHLESYLKDVYEPGQTIENNDEEYVPAVDSISNMSYGIYNNHIYYRKNSMMKKNSGYRNGRKKNCSHDRIKKCIKGIDF